MVSNKPMKSYQVNWSTTIEAKDEQAAAIMALATLRATHSAPVFTVNQDHSPVAVEVDIARVIPSWVADYAFDLELFMLLKEYGVDAHAIEGDCIEFILAVERSHEIMLRWYAPVVDFGCPPWELLKVHDTGEESEIGVTDTPIELYSAVKDVLEETKR